MHPGISHDVPCLFDLYAEYIVQNVRLDEAQARMKIARRNIKNLRYADDTTLMGETEEEPKSLLVKMKEEGEKLTFNIQKTKIMTSGPMKWWDQMPWSLFSECWALSQLFHSKEAF